MRNNKSVTHKGIEVTPLRFVKWWITVLILTHITVVTPILMAYLQLNPIAIYSNQFSATTSILLTLGISSIILAGTAYLYYIRNQTFTPTVKQLSKEAVSKPVDLPIVNISEPLRELAGADNYLKPGAVAQKTTINGEVVDLYSINQINFNLRTEPHCLITGRTGAGKTTSLYNLLKIFNKQFRYPKVILVDSGNRDFPDAIAHDYQKVTEVYNMLYYIVKGRQCEPKDAHFEELLFVHEEIESYLKEVAVSMKPAQFKQTVSKIAGMIIVARKLKINFLVAGQTLKTTDLPSDIRNNLSQRFYMKLSKTAARMYGVPHSIENLQAGLAYMENIGAFVQFDFIEKQPPLNALTWDQLKAYSDGYKRKYNLQLDVTD